MINPSIRPGERPELVQVMFSRKKIEEKPFLSRLNHLEASQTSWQKQEGHQRRRGHRRENKRSKSCIQSLLALFAMTLFLQT
jgi:hypothetical protein